MLTSMIVARAWCKCGDTHGRSLKIVALGSLVSVTFAMTSCASSSVLSTSRAGTSQSDGAGVVQEQMLASEVAQFGELGDITQASVTSASPSQLSDAGRASGMWVSLQSSASDYLGEEHARWVANMITAELWKTSSDQGLPAIVGGSLAPMAEGGVVDGAGVNLELNPNLQAIMFKDSDGVSTSPLTVADQSGYKAAVQQAASSAGLSLISVKFTQTSIGTIVEIDEVAQDPTGFVAKYGDTNPGLTLDPNAVEGVFLTVQDANGDLVMSSDWNVGSQSGEGGIGPKYATANSGDATPGPSQPLVTAQPSQ